MTRRSGGFRGAKPTWTTTSTSGIFGMEDVVDLKAAGQWPRGPVAPTSLAGTGGDQQVALTWVAPATTHGTITDYVVEYTPAAGSPTVVATGSTAASYTVTGLTNDTEYTFRVKAVNHTRGDWSSSVTGTPSTVVPDPDFANVVLLLHMDGSNGSTTFTDSSSYGRTATVYRNAALSNTQSKFGGTSGYFSGGTTGSGTSQTADTITFADSNDFNMGSSDWTIEAWIYVTSLSTNREFWSQRNDPAGSPLSFIRVNTTGTLRLYFSGGVTDLTSTETLSVDTWYHVAVVRSSLSVSAYIDGVAATLTGTNGTGSYGDIPSAVSIGSGSSVATTNGWGSPFSGYIDDFRWTIGTARYTANFTPPTAAFPDQ